MTDLDLNDTIELLVGKRAPSFAFEREIRLFQFQIWILFPKSQDKQSEAGLLAAGKFLERIQNDKYGTQLLSARKLKRLLDDDDYGSLYKAAFAPWGGLIRLIGTRHPRALDRNVKELDGIYDVCEIMDYRFRYLDHGGDITKGTITYGQLYRTKEPGNPLSYRILKDKWSPYKPSAEYLYVSERLGVSLRPPDLRRQAFVNRISSQAANKEHLQKFFGQCAYVIRTLHGQKAPQHEPRIPATIEPIRPSTTPLKPDEIARVSNYNEDSKRMKGY